MDPRVGGMHTGYTALGGRTLAKELFFRSLWPKNRVDLFWDEGRDLDSRGHGLVIP